MAYKLANYIPGFRKSHVTQYSLIMMFKKWTRSTNKGDYVSALFMDLANVFDTINHGLMLAELNEKVFKESKKVQD